MTDHLATDPRPAAAGPQARGAEAAAASVRAGTGRARTQPVAAQRGSRAPDHGTHGSPARDGKQLERTLGVPGLTVHYITSVIGTGVLILPGQAAHGAGPLSLAAWALLVAFSYPFALVFARLSVRHPTSQGIPGVIQLAFGPRWSRLTSTYLMLTLVVTNPVLGLAAARYLLSMWYPAPANLQVAAAGFGFVGLSVLFNLLGIRASARVQAAVLGALIVFLVLVMAVALPHARAARLTPVAPHGWTALGPALIICFFGFIGWENAAPVAGEVINPRRTFPRAIRRAVATVGFLYLSMALTVVLVLPRDTTGSQQITAFSTLLQIATGHALSQAGDMVAVVLLVLSMNAWTLGTSRVVYSQARTGLLPRRLARVSGRGNAPRAALLALLAGYAVPVGALMLSGRDESTLITASSAAFLLIFLISFLAARRLLEGRAIRWCIRLVTAGTLAFLPFSGVSMLYAAAIAILAAGLEYSAPWTRHAARRSQLPVSRPAR
jgi:amino acid efflux transporter